MMLGEPCRYITNCGWCWKWDKKCDKKIGKSCASKPKSNARQFVDEVKSGKLPSIDESDFGLQNIFEPIPMKDVTGWF